MISNKKINKLLMESSSIASQGRDSCSSCNYNYCCVSQKVIEISTLEWEDRKHLIEQKHIDRAKVQIERFDKEGLFTCPFNDPVTGQCDIYDERFIVCAQYRVINNKEHCNSDTRHGLQVVNPMNIFTILMNKDKTGKAREYMMHYSTGEPISIIDGFKEI